MQVWQLESQANLAVVVRAQVIDRIEQGHRSAQAHRRVCWGKEKGSGSDP